MCRLLGFIASSDPKNLFEEFNKLKEVGCVPCGAPPGHVDGWGGIVWENNRQIILRDSNSITSEAEKPLLEFIKNSGNFHGVLHMRKASVGSVCLENTHPFYRGGISFSHNGSIKAKGDSNFVTDRNYREGHTDSETFFLRILDRLEVEFGDQSLESIKRAVLAELEEVKTFAWTSLTLIISTREGLLINYLWNDQHPKSVEEEFEKYYTMYEGMNDEGETFLCSESLNIKGVKWVKLDNNTQKIYLATYE